MKVVNSILELIGNTPLVKLNKIIKENNVTSNFYCKIEMFNPSGSIKIRPAYQMIKELLDKEIITYSTPIIEATSGNMGIALALVCSVLGLEFIACMPENMSQERIKLIEAYGGRIIKTKKELGMKGSVVQAEVLEKELNGYIIHQFDNINNPLSHYLTTGNEIYEALDGKIDYVFCGIGTGGTISGIAKVLKEKINVKIIGVEPYESPLITKGKSGLHQIQGIGANFIPKNLDLSLIDDVITVKSEEAIKFTKELALKEGLFVGVSSGAALASAISYVKEKNIKNKNIVIILPDTGERYLSMEL